MTAIAQPAVRAGSLYLVSQAASPFTGTQTGVWVKTSDGLLYFRASGGTSSLVATSATINDVLEGGGTPTVAIGADLGTAPNGAAVAVSGNDRAHTLTITAGTDATAGGNAIITVTFGAEWGGTPRVLLGPADDDSFYVLPSMGQGDPYLAFRQADVTTTGYIIRAGTGPNLVGFSFKLNVMVGR